MSLNEEMVSGIGKIYERKWDAGVANQKKNLSKTMAFDPGKTFEIGGKGSSPGK